jgi:ubiquinone/menaquinone biosynthesis C-methylase UbiE
MNLKELQDNWNRFADTDPLWSILTDEGKRGNRWQVEEFFQNGEAEIAALMEYMDTLRISVKKSKALDFGCGVGRLTQALAKHFERTEGVDISKSMIVLADQYNRHRDRCRYTVNEADNLGLFDDNEFDFICSFITLQHMKPLYAKGYINEFIRILKPEGILVFQIPGERERSLLKLLIGMMPPKLFGLVFQTIYRTDAVMQMNGIRREELAEFLEEKGAVILDIKEDGRAGKGWKDYQYVATKRSPA